MSLDQPVKTLQPWKYLLGPTPRILDFPKLELISGHDWEPAIIVGKGEVVLRTASLFEYSITGIPDDLVGALHRLRKAEDNPYDAFEQFRLIGTDADGIDWNFGWTSPTVSDINGNKWTLTGTIRVLSTDDKRASVNASSSVENIFEIAADHPMVPIIGGYTSLVIGRVDGLRSHSIDVLGTRVSFSYEPGSRLLYIEAPTSSQFNHPCAENWLAEPLRIIFGQLVFPRLVARNFGDGRAMVSLRPSPSIIRSASFSALWADEIVDKGKEQFWRLYARLLTYVAKARDDDGEPNFQRNQLTQFYEEIAQATRGTRWVWALTLASVVEGQVNTMMPASAVRDGTDLKAIADLSGHISKWQGSNELKSRAIQGAKRAAEITATSVLVSLRNKGAITKSEVDSWKDIRNLVMHGTLISPWSEKTEDGHLRNLTSLFHKLTLEMLSYSEARF